MKQHKHSKCIKAWADGAAIESYWENIGWEFTAMPNWYEHVQYRIRPEAKPDIVRGVLAVNTLSAGVLLYVASPAEANCELVFDAETNKLKGCTFKASTGRWTLSKQTSKG
tara:strand:+ start:404 stop:736 length:333 start_codon:yes stop_codon:yes gene_type:complete